LLFHGGDACLVAGGGPAADEFAVDDLVHHFV
jgi:hypothetical protein